MTLLAENANDRGNGFQGAPKIHETQKRGERKKKYKKQKMGTNFPFPWGKGLRPPRRNRLEVGPRGLKFRKIPLVKTELLKHGKTTGEKGGNMFHAGKAPGENHRLGGQK